MINYRTKWFYSKDKQIKRRLYDNKYHYFVTHNSHQFMQLSPLEYPRNNDTITKLTCAVCGIITEIGKWNIPRCMRKTFNMYITESVNHEV